MEIRGNKDSDDESFYDHYSNKELILVVVAVVAANKQCCLTGCSNVSLFGKSCRMVFR